MHTSLKQDEKIYSEKGTGGDYKDIEKFHTRNTLKTVVPSELPP